MRVRRCFTFAQSAPTSMLLIHKEQQKVKTPLHIKLLLFGTLSRKVYNVHAIGSKGFY